MWMVSDELRPVAIAIAIVIAIPALIAFVVRRRNEALLTVLLRVVTGAGWSDLRPMKFLASGYRGTWRSLPVELAYGGRQKSVPARFILKIAARSTTRALIKRRMYGLFGRPFTLFGPPLVELRYPAAKELWVRADEAAFAERLFADDKLALQIANNLVAAYDEVRIGPKGLRIIRSLDDRPVRAKYAMPAFTFKFEPERYEPIAREEIALGQALVEKLA